VTYVIKLSIEQTYAVGGVSYSCSGERELILMSVTDCFQDVIRYRLPREMKRYLTNRDKVCKITLQLAYIFFQNDNLVWSNRKGNGI